ncbi:MAG: hypothetical protein JW910_05560 [Anaerolineae bacterium]|nr:hypothetical protein [Anaerolineae bacterium]
MSNLDDLTREQLITLLEVYAKNWLAHDGNWFLAVEERFGIETAIELDTRAWERFSPVEAGRIMREFGIEHGGGLEALAAALPYRLYGRVNEQRLWWDEDGALRYEMVACRVQQARRRKGLPDFPCKPVGIVEYTEFARTVDPRLRVECLACPPDPVGEQFCAWRFTLEDEPED